MKALIIGTGSIGQRHIRNLRTLHPGLSFILLRKNARKDALSESLDAIVIEQLDEAIALAPDFAVIANPSSMHAEFLDGLIKSDIPVYIEKPVVINHSQLQNIQSLLQQKEIPVTLTGCNLRFLPSLKKMKALLDEGAIGQPLRASFTAGQWLPDWRPDQDYKQSYSADSSKGGGVILDLIHELDAARWLLGEMSDVSALHQHAPVLEIDSESVAVAIMKSSSEVLVTVSVDYIARKPVRRYEVVGDKGSLIWNLINCSLSLETPAGTELINCGEQGFDLPQTYISAMQAFLDAIKNKTRLSQDLQDGLRSVELALSVKDEMQ